MWMQIKGTYREIWNISFPIMLGTLAYSVNQIIDTVYLGNYANTALEAITIVSIYYFVFLFFAAGIARGCQVIISRHNGEMAYHKIGIAFDHLLVIGMVLSLLLFIFYHFFTPLLIPYLIKNPAIQTDAVNYMKGINWSTPFMVLGFCYNGFYSGIGKTRIITWATIGMAITNAILGYLFIFGNFGLHPMGIKGAGISTGIANVVLLLFYIVDFYKQKYAVQYHSYRFKNIQWDEIKSILQLSSPIVLQNTVGVASWCYFYICVERLGGNNLAVSGILKSLFIFLGIPIWSFSSTSNTVVSNIIGQGRTDAVVPALKKVLLLAVIITGSSVLFVLLFPNFVFSLFTNDASILQDIIKPYQTLSIGMFFFMFAMVMNQSIVGTGATFIPAFVEVVCSISYVIYCEYFIIHLHSPLYIAWGCEILYWMLLFTFTFVYWYSGIWRKYIKHIDTLE